MKRIAFLSILVVLAASLVVLVLTHPSRHNVKNTSPAPTSFIALVQSSATGATSRGSATVVTQALEQPPGNVLPDAKPSPRPGASSDSQAEFLNLPPSTVLENMRTTIHSYASMFGGNPVGVNAEITTALCGDNPKHANFLKPDGNRVNEKGELVDPWGTPYFFHQLSGTEMEVRSAGPDKKLWTDDDLVTR
jgi:hypothetical protein